MFEGLRQRRSVGDLRVLGEAALVIIATWLVLGWTFGDAISHGDGAWLGAPYTASALRAGPDWTRHLYRFGVLGGSEMHTFGGTLPLVQLAAILGLSTTLTMNLVTWFIQLCYAFFGLRMAEALSNTRMTAAQRVLAIWLVAFAPLLGWRLVLGHENLLLGFLPLFVLVSLAWQVRAGRPSAVQLVLAMLAIWHGVSGLGAQGLVYSAVFGLPLVIVACAPFRECQRPAMLDVAIACVAGVLVALPRLAPMIAHATSDDATRSVSTTVTSSYGTAPLTDWVASLPWTIEGHAYGGLHEHNYPIGPLVVLVIALAWRLRRARAFIVTLLLVLLLVILFACEIGPFAHLKELPLLHAFRGPSRAAIAVLMFVPVLAVASVIAVPDRGRAWLGILGALVAILALHDRLPIAREVTAWLAAFGFVAALHWHDRMPRFSSFGLLCMLASLGVCAFSDRIPRDVPSDPIERGPTVLHQAIRDKLPDLTTALDRVVIPDGPPPYEMSLAFASDVPSIDGVWYPPRRFLDLLSALEGHPLPPMTSVFRPSSSRAFTVLQQLYNVRVMVRGLGTPNAEMLGLPRPAGPAWFPHHLVVGDATPFAKAVHSATDLHSTLVDSAWITQPDSGDLPTTCDDARVVDVKTDALGQSAEIRYDAPTSCVLVVATNFTRLLRATKGGNTLRVVPVDVALTGIVVPAGSETVVLAPRVDIPTWTWIAELLGMLGLLAVCALHLRRGAT